MALSICILTEAQLASMTEAELAALDVCAEVVNPDPDGGGVRVEDRATVYDDVFEPDSVNIFDGPTRSLVIPRVNPDQRSPRRWL